MTYRSAGVFDKMLRSVRALYAAGASHSECSRILGCSERFVWLHCKDIARPFKRPAMSRHWRSSRAVARHKMQEHLGRKLTRSEHVHHINGDYTDNRLENLEVLSASEHLSLHNKGVIRVPLEQQWLNKTEVANCAVCGGQFRRIWYLKRKVKTCSRPCASLLMSSSQKRRVFIREPQANSSTGLRGVEFHSRLKSKPYMARLAGRYLGYFASAAEAEAAINAALAELSQ